MAYRIIADYQTGNSFGHHDEQDEVIVNESLDIAKENLRRIQEHHAWNQDHNDSFKRRRRESGYDTSKPAEKPSWLTGEYDFQINLKMDNGEDVLISAFWIGYFEKLHSVEIVTEQDDDMKITF